MSPIGRVFIVLNLGLAFAFVGFAGTYLKHATNWKAQHDKVAADLEELQKRSAQELAAVQSDLENAKNNLTRNEANLRGAETRLEEAKTENERLQAQLASLEGSLKQTESSLKTVKDTLEAATSKADEAYKMAIKASDERNEALTAKVKAEDELRQANSKIADLESKLAENNALVARLEQEIGEKDLLISHIRVQNGGLLPDLTPSMSGSIVTVGKDGKLVTARLEQKAGEPKPGHNLAIHANGRYKGEFVVDQVEGDFLFGRVIRQVEGVQIAAGDKVDSQPGR